MIDAVAINGHAVNAAAGDDAAGVLRAALRLSAHGDGKAACGLTLRVVATGQANAALVLSAVAPSGYAVCRMQPRAIGRAVLRAPFVASAGQTVASGAASCGLAARLTAVGTARTDIGSGGLWFGVGQAVAVAPVAPDQPTPPGSVGGRSIRWRVQAQAAGQPLDLVGRVSIQAEENGARTATLSARGPVDATGQIVTVDLRVDAASTRLYSGSVDTADYDPDTDVTTLRCTDRLQSRIDALSREQIELITPGAITPPGNAEQGWTYLNTRLATVPMSVFLRADGGFKVQRWAAATGGVVLDRLLYGSVRHHRQSAADAMASTSGGPGNPAARTTRREVLLTVELSWVRIARTRLRNAWNAGIGICEWLQGYPLPQPETIRQAVASAGWDVESVDVQTLALHGGWTDCGSGAFGLLVAPGTRAPAVRAGWTLSRRYTRSMKARLRYRIRQRDADMNAPVEVTERRITLRDPRDGSDWVQFGAIPRSTGSTPTDPLTQTDPNGDAYCDLIDIRDDEGSFGTALDDAQQQIADVRRAIEWAAAQSGVRVLRDRRTESLSAQTVIRPDVDLGDALTLVHPRLTRSGQVCRLTHDLDIDQGSAITTVEIRIAAAAGDVAFPPGQTSTDTHIADPSTTWSADFLRQRIAPAAANTLTRLPTAPEDDVTRGANVPSTRFGGVSGTALTESDTWQGWVANKPQSVVWTTGPQPAFYPEYKNTGFFVRVPPIRLPDQASPIDLGEVLILV